MIGRIYDAFLINAGQVRLLHQRRRAVWRGIDWPRGKECRETKFSGKKDDGLGILHNSWRSPDFSLAIFIWGFAICLKCIISNA